MFTSPVSRRIAASAIALSTGGAVLLIGPSASAGDRASSTVTISAEGTDLFGHVSSPRSSCKRERPVHVYKQIGTRGGGDDQHFAMDTTDDDGDWSTGNTGTAGKFYAKVKRTALCKKDLSPTITVHR
ncbi:hypothetical protein F0U44_09620 [Nocardioides humilatus]|uniref:Uncharacterized protein n=1 Tax=Nocardioides humilatus TaxID=2607660 RepID=A0A5B1LDC2_9ACTN|nr:hypothetical protein [Nocardioides humilatus]KAA1418741.1 hypothetical protein F0U44_09620 [Nocardioides humilatus]